MPFSPYDAGVDALDRAEALLRAAGRRSSAIRDDLRRQSSRNLRDVERGETFEVTDAGRPVALLVPIPSENGIDRPAASGRLRCAAGDLLELGEPLPSARDAPSPSKLLERLRADER